MMSFMASNMPSNFDTSVVVSIFQNTTPSDASVRHLVYLLENAIMNLGEGQEQMCWLIDFSGFTMKTKVSVKIAADVINILQNHYPERLDVAFLYNPPRIFHAFWKVCSLILLTCSLALAFDYSF